ncbi:MAG TPA: exodeoxyribonuclease VII large subunit [Verrucomicrobiae bacterium]|nr:exodeoxyribonuclease VII large subunit [Verrucomicrobiae bacterium]
MNDQTAPPRVVRGVREFTSGLQRWFAGHRQLQDVAIAGEVSGLRSFGGHLGFTLKEETAVLDCVVWSEFAREIPALENGMAAIASGSVKIRPDRSGYQLIVERVELTGVGALYAMFERLKERFRREGLFDAARKRAVPALPRRVAVISARGKGLEDFAGTLERHVPFVRVEFVETRVQGVGAEIEIATALDEASRRDADLIVLTRGGGSYEDLFPFNLEPVIRAIVRSRHPVVTAIGHSGDHHLADEVADLSLGTPSLAAEHIVKSWGGAKTRLDGALRSLLHAVRDVHVRAAQRLSAGERTLEGAARRIAGRKREELSERSGRLERRNPARVLAESRSRAATGSERIGVAAARLLARKVRDFGERRAGLEAAMLELRSRVQRRFERAEAGLDRNDPLSPLRRGYAIVTKDGRALRDASSVASGDCIEARLERGTLEARVESVRPHE